MASAQPARIARYEPGSESGENLWRRCGTMTRLSRISNSWSNCSPPQLRPRCVQRRPWSTFAGRRSLASLSLAPLSEPPSSRRYSWASISSFFDCTNLCKSMGLYKVIQMGTSGRVATVSAVLTVGSSLDGERPACANISGKTR